MPETFWSRANRQQLGFAPVHPAKHLQSVERIPGVYPYSVVPGGVKNVEALRAAAAADRAVSRHFSHFDYGQAHLVRLSQPREVYVSYRIRDTIFWTRKRVHLPAGEMILTDGKISARAHCGNQISDTAKPEVSDEEPEEDVLDQPVALDPIGPSLPVRPLLSPLDLPSGQPAPPLFSARFNFPYVPYTIPLPPLCEVKHGVIDKRCHPHHKKPVVPEPSTLILLGSGLVAIAWWSRRASRSSSPIGG